MTRPLALSLVLLSAAPAPTPAADDLALRVKVALALASAQATDPAPPRDELSYAGLRAKALAAGKPLVVHVGTVRLDLEQHLPDWTVQSHVLTFPGVTGSGVVLGLPQGGELYRLDFPHAVPLAEVRAAVGRWRQASQATPSVPVFVPRAFAPPAASCGPRG